MSIYTRRGDQGTTRIYGNRSFISKADFRIKCLGAIDELNAQLGLAHVHCQNRELGKKINLVQQDFFQIGAELASVDGSAQFKLNKSVIVRLERWIDEYWKNLPPLANFIFPGGTIASAQLQVARTVCRRAERELVELAEKESARFAARRASRRINPNILAYINRLSDFLLAASRWANHLGKVPDQVWVSTAKKRK